MILKHPSPPHHCGGQAFYPYPTSLAVILDIISNIF